MSLFNKIKITISDILTRMKDVRNALKMDMGKNFAFLNPNVWFAYLPTIKWKSVLSIIFAINVSKWATLRICAQSEKNINLAWGAREFMTGNATFWWEKVEECLAWNLWPTVILSGALSVETLVIDSAKVEFIYFWK